MPVQCLVGKSTSTCLASSSPTYVTYATYYMICFVTQLTAYTLQVIIGKPAAATAPVLIMTSLINCLSDACITRAEASCKIHMPVLITQQYMYRDTIFLLYLCLLLLCCNYIKQFMTHVVFTEACDGQVTAKHSKLVSELQSKPFKTVTVKGYQSVLTFAML